MISEVNMHYDSPNIYDPNFDLSEYRENAKNNYQAWQLDEFVQLAERTKSKLDLPFDQIYH